MAESNLNFEIRCSCRKGLLIQLHKAFSHIDDPENPVMLDMGYGRHFHFILHICLILFLGPPVFSQKGYTPGYVVLNSGDTLYGQVRDRNLSGDRIYYKVRYRGDGFCTRRYSPHEIRGYRTGDSEFDSKWFREDTEFFRFDYYCREGVGEKVFLKVLERGLLTCYFREYIDAESGYLDGYELFQREGEDFYERATQGILGLKKKRLSAYFFDCPSLVMRIKNGQITRPLEVVDFYNDRCADE